MQELVSVDQFGGANVPAIPESVQRLGNAGAYSWSEYFSGRIRNKHTRAAYLHAVRKFLAWLEQWPTPLEQVTPAHVAGFLDQLDVSIPTKKLHLAALRGFFDTLVLRHALILNPALSVRGDRLQVVEGKTPEISKDQARQLLQSIDTSAAVGLRDKCLISTLIYTAARAGAVARLRVGDFAHDGSQYCLRLTEKGTKIRAIPCRHDLQLLLEQHIDVLRDTWGIAAGEPLDRSLPLFPTAQGRTGTLTLRPLTGGDVCRLLKRRLATANLPLIYSPHSLRVATLTDLLLQGVPLEDVQFLAGHADSRVTRLYDRRQRQVSRNIVERISV